MGNPLFKSTNEVFSRTGFNRSRILDVIFFRWLNFGRREQNDPSEPFIGEYLYSKNEEEETLTVSGISGSKIRIDFPDHRLYAEVNGSEFTVPLQDSGSGKIISGWGDLSEDRKVLMINISHKIMIVAVRKQ